MLWACLHFPALALNLVEQGAAAPAPRVVEVSHRQRRLVLHANAAAREQGVVPGMTIPTAQGLVRDLQCRLYDPAAEQQALTELGHWAYEFTPHIRCHGQHSLLLEVGRSLKLFGGARPLARRLQQQLPAGFEPYGLTFAPTDMAALLLARAHAETHAGQALFFSLQSLPACSVQWLEVEDSQKDLLCSMGLHTLEPLLALPRGALARRLGQGFCDYLAQLNGECEPPLPQWTLPPYFQAELDFVQELDNRQSLLFPMRHLLSRLEHYLRARQVAVPALEFSLWLRDRQRQQWPLMLSTPLYRVADILPLVQLHLEQWSLPAPVLTLQLSARRFLPLSAGQQDLFQPHPGDDISRYQLVDRLKARLGGQQVHSLGMVADHRPEYGWCSATPGAGQALQHPSEQRPFWLLRQPRKLRASKGLPVYGAPLQLLKGPERIETGWWDQQPVNRDYYIARRDNGQHLWVYRDRPSQDWFLHGLFAR